MTALSNYVYYVSLTVARVESGAIETKTYNFASKKQKATLNPEEVYPILRSIGEVSLTAGEILPELTFSSIEIDNSIGSFGPNRKFSDVLERYSPVEQTVTLRYRTFSTADDITDLGGSATDLGTGVVVDWSASSADGGGSLIFNIRPIALNDTVLTLEVVRSNFGMENAPSSSLGRVVPLLIGDEAESVPVRITADGATTARYALSTGLRYHLRSLFSAAKLYARNNLDEWEEVKSNFPASLSEASSGSYTLNTYAGRAFYLVRAGTATSAIVAGIKLSCRGNGLVSSNATLSVFLLRFDTENSQIIEEVTRTAVPLSNYNTQNAASTNPFTISVAFDEPVFLSDFEGYAIGYSVTDFQVGDLSLNKTAAGAFQTIEYLRDTSSANNSSGFDWKINAIADNLKYELIYFSPIYSTEVTGDTQSGLTYSQLTMAPSASVDSGQAITPLDNFALLVGGIQGLTDAGSGALIEKPQELVDLLSRKWTGSSWSIASNWDTTTLNSSHYDYLYNGATPSVRSRVVRGMIEQKSTFSQILADICRGTASRVGILPNGKLFLYPFGRTVTPAMDIPYADITTIQWMQRDISNIVNRAVIKTGRTYLNAPRSFEDSSTTGFQFTVDFAAKNYPTVASVTNDSRLLYGNKEMENGEFNVWPYNATSGGYFAVGSAGQGSILGEYYLTRFGKPLTYCTFIVPEARYKSLKMFDVITFTSVNFPAFYGTDSNAKDGTVNVGGAVSVVTTADGGNETVRAKTYRGLIEGISYIMAMEHAPAIRLTVQVLLNQPHDPT